MQVLRQLLRLRMSRNLAPTLVETVPCGQARPHTLLTGRRYEMMEARSLLDPGRYQHPHHDYRVPAAAC